MPRSFTTAQVDGETRSSAAVQLWRLACGSCREASAKVVPRRGSAWWRSPRMWPQEASKKKDKEKDKKEKNVGKKDKKDKKDKENKDKKSKKRERSADGTAEKDVNVNKDKGKKACAHCEKAMCLAKPSCPLPRATLVQVPREPLFVERFR